MKQICRLFKLTQFYIDDRIFQAAEIGRIHAKAA